MTKEEFIGKTLELIKDNKYVFQKMCDSFDTCDACPLCNWNDCEALIIDELCNVIIDLQKKKETNFDHYIVRSGVHITKERDVEVWQFRLKKGTEKQYFDADSKSVLDWLLAPYEEPKPKYKLTQFEIDFIQAYLDLNGERSMLGSYMFNKLQSKGYFKDIPNDVPIKDIIDNCEVIDNG